MAKSISDKINQAGGESSRLNAFNAYPETFTVVADKAHPLYDPRVEWPLDEDVIADFHANGVHTTIKVSDNGYDAKGCPIFPVVEGRRRVLHALEHNRRYPKAKIKVKFNVVHGDDADLVLFALSGNTREAENIGSIAWKARTAIKLGKSEAEIMVALRIKSKPTMDRILAYMDLSKAVQTAVDKGTIPLLAIDSFKDVPREEQGAKLAEVQASGATKVHEIKDALQDLKNGKTPRPANDRKKSWNQKQVRIFEEVLLETCNETRVRDAALAMCMLFRGDTRAFKQSGPPELVVALEMMDKDGEKRRKKIRDRRAKRAEKDAKGAAE